MFVNARLSSGTRGLVSQDHWSPPPEDWSPKYGSRRTFSGRSLDRRWAEKPGSEVGSQTGQSFRDLFTNQRKLDIVREYIFFINHTIYPLLSSDLTYCTQMTNREFRIASPTSTDSTSLRTPLSGMVIKNSKVAPLCEKSNFKYVSSKIRKIKCPFKKKCWGYF